MSYYYIQIVSISDKPLIINQYNMTICQKNLEGIGFDYTMINLIIF